MDPVESWRGKKALGGSPGSLTPHLPHRILARLMDRLAVVSECRQQAADCRARAEAAIEERMRSLLVSMALIWTKLAEEAEQIGRIRENERM
jgi:hypothetical protein